ncbi:MAG TPA: YtxH domain-containing protein [Cytophagaceae bacterium]|jgi:gas vesicle protein|nr:YtxH domain-containing protein [Cytophagaceae bacterium]
MENSNSGKVIGALLLGAAIGGVLGILFAPDKGSETRKKIMANSDELTDAVKEKLKKFLEQVESATEKATECIENGIEKV